MKIAMLVRQFSGHGGLELYAHKVVEGLLAGGVKVTVVCQEKESDLESVGLDFKMIEPAGYCRGKHARIAQLFAGANRALAQLDDIDLVHSQHCPTERADVVTFHNHSTRRLSQVGLWWERVVNDNKRLLVPAYRLRHQQDEALLRRALCLIFPAEVMKEDYFSTFPFLQGPPPKPYVVAHPGASLAGAAPGSSEKDSQSGPFNFLFVGRGFRKKGLDILLAACCRLKDKEKRDFRLLIAGLSERPAERIRLRLLGLENQVKFLGFQKDMEPVYARARAVILPSRVEPFGMAPVQAMQRGLVPVVSRVSGVAEVLRDGHDSLILNNHLNADELAGLMSKLINEPDLLSRLSANALVTAEKVSWQETVNQTLKAYETALSVKK